MIDVMAYPFFAHNGEILASDQAKISLNKIEYAYGFGVYENIRVLKGKPNFLSDHIERLLKSAEIIGLQHNFKKEFISQTVRALVNKNEVDACNIKILLIGGHDADNAILDILCLNPLYPDRRLYKEGVQLVTYNYERDFPQAKSFNMLRSYLAYRHATQNNAYDSLLIDYEDCIREGTRTNFFGLNDKQLISPPAEHILLGVTRDKIIEAANKYGYSLAEKPIKLSEVGQFDSVFLTSTSAKIMPIKQIDNVSFDSANYEPLKNLMKIFDDFLSTS